MKKILQLTLLTAVIVAALFWFQKNYTSKQQVEISNNASNAVNRMIDEDTRIDAINAELKEIEDRDYDAEFFKKLSDYCFDYANLEEYLEWEKRWNRAIKLYMIDDLKVPLKKYVGFMELKISFYDLLSRRRDIIKKRYGQEEMEKRWEEELNIMLEDYYVTLEALLEDFYQPVLEYNVLFNKKLNVQRAKEFKESAINIGV